MFSYLFKKLVNQPLEAFYRKYVFKDIVKPKKPGYPATLQERTFTAKSQAREHFYVYFRKWCCRASQIAFHDCQKNCKIMYFQELFIWLAPEHQL